MSEHLSPGDALAEEVARLRAYGEAQAHVSRQLHVTLDDFLALFCAFNGFGYARMHAALLALRDSAYLNQLPVTYGLCAEMQRRGML